jgi:hypothetical protein
VSASCILKAQCPYPHVDIREDGGEKRTLSHTADPASAQIRPVQNCTISPTPSAVCAEALKSL